MSDNTEMFPGTPLAGSEWIEKDWNLAYARAVQLFEPTSPIDQNRFFAGRIPQAVALLDSVYQKGAHSIIFGERGVGKSSLANIIQERVPPEVSNIRFVKVNCRPRDTFFELWGNALYDFDYDEGENIGDALNGETREFVVNKILEKLQKVQRYVFIFDEFDRVESAEVKRAMADTIKHFSDYPTNVTIIIVGVGFSIIELFGAHPSIERCCRQIPIERMGPDECMKIIKDRLTEIGLHCQYRNLSEIVDLAQGFPGFVHLLGREASVAAIEDKSRAIKEEHIATAILNGEEKAQESLRRLYTKATYSAKANKYKEVLTACAMADKDELGMFSPSDVTSQLEDIYKKTGSYIKPIEIGHFARHLAAFCEEGRGPVLRKTGKPKRYQYQFLDAPFQPYVKLKGRKLGLI